MSKDWNETRKREAREREANATVEERRRRALTERPSPKGAYERFYDADGRSARGGGADGSGGGERIAPRYRVEYVPGRGLVRYVRDAMTDDWIDASTGRPAAPGARRWG